MPHYKNPSPDGPKYRLNQPAPKPTTEAKQARQKRKHHFIRWLIILILLIGGGSWGYNYLKNNQTTHVGTINALLAYHKAHQKDRKLTFEYYHKPGCPDCKQVEKAGIEKQLNRAALKYNVVEINTTNLKKNGAQSAKNWFADNYVVQVPTLIVKYQGYPIYLYSGTNDQIFNKMLHGINPKTNQPFKLTKPQYEHYQNDFDKSSQNFISVDPLHQN